MRLMFYRPSSAHYVPEQPVPFQTGVPVSSASDLAAHNRAFWLVGNSGNMIHRMAMVQTLDFDRATSSSVHLIKLAREVGIPRAAEIVNENFDAAMLTFSNIVNPSAEEGELADILEHISIPLYAVGIGIQDAFEAKLSNLHPTVAKLLKVLDKKAKLFGVRGDSTKEWLNKAGLKSPVAIGCPSMYVYPRNVYALKPPKRLSNIMTAGHMGAVDLRPEGNQRARKLIDGFTQKSEKAPNISYVFQGEVRNYANIKSNRFVFNEATSTLHRPTINKEIERVSGMTSPFNRFYSFNDVGSWRQACLRHDVFVGDRIHGAVAAMQAGIPALVIYDDVRVQELAGYHGIPRCSLDEFAELGYREVIEKYLTEDGFTAFHDRYSKVLKVFTETLRGRGLKLSIDAEVESVLKAAAA